VVQSVRRPSSLERRDLRDDRRIEYVAIRSLGINPRNARTHSKKQIRQVADSIKRFGFNTPIIIDNESRIIAGHARAAASRELGLTRVPVIRVCDLSEVEKRAYMLADNKIAANAGWDRELLAEELQDLQGVLPEIGLDLDLTGFEPP